MGSNTFARRAVPRTSAQAPKFFNAPQRSFATQLEVKKEEESRLEVDNMNQRIGIDMAFSEQKHAYVLTFPWNFPEIINDFESEYRPLSSSSFWH